MNPEENRLDPALERGISEIREGAPEPAEVEAAAARVWARLSTEAPVRLQGCAGFQSLFPEYRAGRLSEARLLLLKDHLNECVACRKALQADSASVVPFPAPAAPRHAARPVWRWAAAAAATLVVGLGIWFAAGRYGGGSGPAVVQSVNGTLYAATAEGFRTLTPGQEAPEGVLIRTARDSGAVLRLGDGSLVELRERSDLSTSRTGADLTLKLGHGSVFVEAAKRRSGHLYVATADCRVAVTGTVFSVSAAAKGSRVSVIEGEVRVSQGGAETVLRPGDQLSTGEAIAPVAVEEDVAWSRQAGLRGALAPQLAVARKSLNAVPPGMRFSSRLLDRLPASTVFFASVPNVAGYLGDAPAVVGRSVSQNADLRAWWGRKMETGGPADFASAMQRLGSVSEWLGDEIGVIAVEDGSGKVRGPIFLAEVKRDGFPDALKRASIPLASAVRGGMVAFGPESVGPDTLSAVLDSPAGGFAAAPFHKWIADSYRDGAGILVGADLLSMRPSAGHSGEEAPLGGARYVIAGQREVENRSETRAVIGFDGPRTGIAAWLATPAPIAALDYVSPDATFVAAFAVKTPAAIVEELLALRQGSQAGAHEALQDAQSRLGVDVRSDLSASLGGEFALALDGPAFPVPSWKLVTEVYDAPKFQATLEKLIAAYNREAAKRGGKPLRTAQETAGGRTYYTVAAADPNPLTEAHYVFAGGYLIAGPTRVQLDRALQTKAAGLSVTRSAAFTALVPRDRYADFSAVVYQNLGATLAPLAGLLGASGQGSSGRGNMLTNLTDLKPFLIAAWGEPDRVTVAASGSAAGMNLRDLLGGNLQQFAAGALAGAHAPGTSRPRAAYR